METYNEIVVFGLGGVGSWISDYIVRSQTTNILRIVDFDKVEEKNLARQNYTIGQVGGSKVESLKNKLERTKIKDEMTILTYDLKVTDEIDVETFNKKALAIICTDNIMSKRLIAKHFDNFIIVNCDKNFVEIKNFLDETDLKSWDMGGGYSNQQNILSNLNAAYATFSIIAQIKQKKDCDAPNCTQHDVETFHVKIKNENDIIDLISNSLVKKEE